MDRDSFRLPAFLDALTTPLEYRDDLELAEVPSSTPGTPAVAAAKRPDEDPTRVVASARADQILMTLRRLSMLSLSRSVVVGSTHATMNELGINSRTGADDSRDH